MKFNNKAVLAAALVLATAGSAFAQAPTPVIPIAVSDVTGPFITNIAPFLVAGALTVGALGLGARLIKRLFAWGRGTM
jgi:ABC-type sugar transport system substrate-binding protein